MSSPILPQGALSLRRYGAGGAPHRHDHVQVVIGVHGQIELEVEGRGGRVDNGRAAFIAPGSDHAQSGDGHNQFLVLDCTLADMGDDAVERLRRQTFLAGPRGRAAARRVRAARLPGIAGARHHHRPLCPPADRRRWWPSAGLVSRLDPLLRRIEAAPGEAWPAARMAVEAGLSVSRLHAVFRAEHDRTPQAWLSDLRLRAVQDALAGTTTPIAQLALDAGYLDQTALTRALRRATRLTPAAYRKLHQGPIESGSNLREPRPRRRGRPRRSSGHGLIDLPAARHAAPPRRRPGRDRGRPLGPRLPRPAGAAPLRRAAAVGRALPRLRRSSPRC